MFLLNTQLEVNWLIPATVSVYTFDSFDIIIKPPSGDQLYMDSAIAVEDFLAPTTTNDGYVTYRFTPDLLGLWTIALTTGVGTLNYIYYEYKLQIDINDTFTQKSVRSEVLRDLP